MTGAGQLDFRTVVFPFSISQDEQSLDCVGVRTDEEWLDQGLAPKEDKRGQQVPVPRAGLNWQNP